MCKATMIEKRRCGRASATSWSNKRKHTKRILLNLRRNLRSHLNSYRREDLLIKTSRRTLSKLL